MLQKEKVCYWSQYSSFPHILQGSSAQCIRHSCYPGRYSGWLANKVEKGHLKSFSSSEQYGHTLKENKSSHSTSPQHHPHISKHVLYTGKKGRILPLQIVQSTFCSAVSWGSLLGLHWGVLPLHVHTGNFWFICSSSNPQFNFYQFIKDLHSVFGEKARVSLAMPTLCNDWLMLELTGLKDWAQRFRSSQKSQRS